jgi:hypothetical protein
MNEMFEAGNYNFPDKLSETFNKEAPDSSSFKLINNYLNLLEQAFNNNLKKARYLRDSLTNVIASNRAGKDGIVRLKTDYYNNGLATFVLNGDLIYQSVEKPDRIIRKYEPAFMPPTADYGRAHFCAPFKMIGSLKIDTFWFNLIIVWLVSWLLYIALYFNILRKALSGFDRTSRRRSDSSFLIIKEISSW